MAETIRVPIAGDSVVNQAHAETGIEQPVRETGFVNGQYVPPATRTTLHKTRLGAAMASRQAEAKAATTAPQPSQTEALSQQIATLQTAVNALTASQLGNMQRGQAEPERESGVLDQLIQHTRYGSGPYTGDGSQQQYGGPDPTLFDFYDDLDATNYHKLNNDHIERTVQQRLEAERASQQTMAQLDDLNRQAEALRARFGRDRNFQEVLPAAGQLITESGYKLSAEEAYMQVSNEIEAKSGGRRSSYMPEDVKTLGGIMRYNQETGRATPSTKRG